VLLFNRLAGQNEEYSLLGPWESDPVKNIISYRSPLGSELLNHKVGDELEFTISDRQFSYEVKKIEKADVD
jgi:transcription elongation GreA/GreB family factor